MKDFEKELESSFKVIKEGDILDVTVIGISETELTVDLNYYTEGIIPLEECSDDPAFSIKNDVLKTFFMTKTYRKLCFYDKKQTHLKMAHVVSCRFVYIKTVLPKIAPFLRVSSLCFYFADFLLVVRFFVAGFSSLSFIICRQASNERDAGSLPLGIL